ncbi:YppF family protein [Bacillus tianshenii]|nr:YppF family protein [Bacillus tianshenii]
MTLEHVIHSYMKEKDEKPATANELLDYIRRAYIHGELSIADYRELVRELEERGAAMPL